MIHTMDCKIDINAQDATYPTYKKVDCDLHTNANDANFYGRLIDCTIVITNVLVTACLSWNQGIRLIVIIDDIDVSAALTGSLNIQHNKNMISTASLNLGDITYSPRTNSHIDLEKVIIITAYINGQEKKLFTGLLDEPEAENTPAFKIIITSRDYGKKLLDKKDTLSCVINTYPTFSWEGVADRAIVARHGVIAYIAEHAGITNYDIPVMDPITIANSFSHQSLWDMIQKEAMAGLYWVKFSEDNVMQLKLDDIKSDISLYPTPDWSYDEDRIIKLKYKRGRVDINKIIILGKTFENRIPVISDVEELLDWKLDYAQSPNALSIEDIYISGDYSIKINYISGGSYSARYAVDVTWSDSDYEVTDYQIAGENISVYGEKLTHSKLSFYFIRGRTEWQGDYLSGFLFIFLEGKERDLYEIQYDQISASVIDSNSIAKYGERNGGSIEYPLLETEAQCKAVGEKIIRDSHRLSQQADFLIPFNPLIQTGQTIAITDKKIDITERYYIESISHNIDINEGKIKARTQIGGVYYT